MADFAYTAIDRSGKRAAGIIPADSRSAAIEAVIQRGLSPLSIHPTSATQRAGASSPPASPAPRKVPAKSVQSFTRELANLLAAGLSLSRALALLRREASHPAARDTWSQIHDDVVGGQSLADALARHPQSFSRVYVAMVRAGEAGGFLHVVLQQITDFRQREQDLRSKVTAALIYPVALTTVAAAVMIFLLTFFIPRFSVIFEQFGSQLPLLTQIVVAASESLVKIGPFIALAAVVAFIVLRRWFTTEPGRRWLDHVTLKLPGVGKLVARFAMVRFTRMLGTLTGAGVPLVASLRVAREAIGNQTLTDTVTHSIEQVRQGVPLATTLAACPVLFPPSVVEMISVASETGRLDQELIRLSTAYEQDLDRELKLTVAVAEPLLLVAMAAVIGTVVVSMLLPIFTLQDMIQ
ncbi:MAG: type II secretion system F family protein [Phycisphaerales bacterium]